MRVLVCGSRKWSDKQRIYDELKKLPIGTIVIEGGAGGADTLANDVAKELDFKVKEYPANWERYGKAAGPIRNKQMLDEGKPDIIYAFHNDIANSKGTLNMISQGIEKEIPFKLFCWKKGGEMRKLDIEEIEKLASRKNVKRIAVENFLMSMGNDNKAAIINLKLDTQLYKWNIHTIKAIKEGIILASGS